MGKGGYGIQIKGIHTFDYIKKELDNTFSKGRFIRIMREASHIAYERAYHLCPVETGKLKGMLVVTEVRDSKGGWTFSLENECSYAWYNEFGWSAIPPVPNPPKYVKYKGGYRPFMRIGALKAEKYIEKEVMKRIEKSRLWGR
jgi:hypothetical protein